METAINLLLRKFRKKHQLTQVQAAKLLAIPLGSLRDYEQSRYTPNGLVALGLMERMRRCNKQLKIKVKE